MCQHLLRVQECRFEPVTVYLHCIYVHFFYYTVCTSFQQSLDSTLHTEYTSNTLQALVGNVGQNITKNYGCQIFFSWPDGCTNLPPVRPSKIWSPLPPSASLRFLDRCSQLEFLLAESHLAIHILIWLIGLVPVELRR